MRNAGLYSTDKIRPANEARFEARWRLGQLLAKVERGTPGPKREKDMSRAGTYFRAYLKEIGLDKNRANEAQRIGALPTLDHLRKAFQEARQRDVLTTIQGLIDFACPLIGPAGAYESGD